MIFNKNVDSASGLEMKFISNIINNAYKLLISSPHYAAHLVQI